MTKGLEYGHTYTEHWNNQPKTGFLELKAPKELVDFATSSGGPLLDDVREPVTKKAFMKTFDGEGGVTLSFNLDQTGQGMSWSPEARAYRMMAIISQLDKVATLRDLSDPRISIFQSGSRHAGGELMVSFDRPAGVDDTELAERIQSGMVHAATLLHLKRTKGFTMEEIAVDHSDASGFTIHARDGDILPLLVDARVPSADGRIVLLSETPESPLYGYAEAHARLAAIGGIVSALDPLHSTRGEQ